MIRLNNGLPFLSGGPSWRSGFTGVALAAKPAVQALGNSQRSLLRRAALRAQMVTTEAVQQSMGLVAAIERYQACEQAMAGPQMEGGGSGLLRL